jgi:hypothetical protein
MKLVRRLLVVISVVLLTACSRGKPDMTVVRVDLPLGTNNENATQVADSLLTEAASKLCGKKVSVTADKIMVTTGENRGSKIYRASAAIDCG